MNLRFVPMAAAAARSLKGGPVRRAFEGQSVIDGSWVAAQRADGTTDREFMMGATLVQWPAWVAGTVLGALLVPSADTLYRLGLDVVFPCFFLLLLLDALRSRPDHLPVALTAAGIAGLCAVRRAGRRRATAVRGRQPGGPAAAKPPPLTGALVVGIVALALINFAFKAVGPAVLGDREPSPTVLELLMSCHPRCSPVWSWSTWAAPAGRIWIGLRCRRWPSPRWPT